MKQYKIRLESGTEIILETTVWWEYVPSYIFNDDMMYALYSIDQNKNITYRRMGNALQIQ